MIIALVLRASLCSAFIRDLDKRSSICLCPSCLALCLAQTEASELSIYAGLFS